MKSIIAKILVQVMCLTAASFAVALSANAVRPDGIPLVAQVPYDIFAPCRDSEVQVQAICAECVAGKTDMLYVDARSAEAFATGHVDGAINAPYSVLAGASASDVAAVKSAATQRGVSTIVVYGAVDDLEAPGQSIDLGKPLAEQLAEAGLTGARHYEGSLDELKNTATWTVQGGGQ